MSILVQVVDSTEVRSSVQDGHTDLGITMNLLTVFVTVVILVGTVLLLKYYFKEKRTRNRP